MVTPWPGHSMASGVQMASEVVCCTTWQNEVVCVHHMASEVVCYTTWQSEVVCVHRMASEVVCYTTWQSEVACAMWQVV